MDLQLLLYLVHGIILQLSLCLTDAVARRVRCSVGDVSFTAKSGNIVEQDCDAIVNSTDEKLDLSRGLIAYLFVCFVLYNSRLNLKASLLSTDIDPATWEA